MKKLNEMNKKELSSVALDLGLTLSYKDDNGKRQRYTMSQLIAMIEAVQMENEVVEVAPATIEETKVETIETEIEVNVNEVVPYTIETLRKITCADQLQQFRSNLISYIHTQTVCKKNSLKSKWALQLNKVKFLLSQFESRLNHMEVIR